MPKKATDAKSEAQRVKELWPKHGMRSYSIARGHAKESDVTRLKAAKPKAAKKKTEEVE